MASLFSSRFPCFFPALGLRDKLLVAAAAMEALPDLLPDPPCIILTPRWLQRRGSRAEGPAGRTEAGTDLCFVAVHSGVRRNLAAPLVLPLPGVSGGQQEICRSARAGVVLAQG